MVIITRIGYDSDKDDSNGYMEMTMAMTLIMAMRWQAAIKAIRLMRCDGDVQAAMVMCKLRLSPFTPMR